MAKHHIEHGQACGRPLRHGDRDGLVGFVDRARVVLHQFAVEDRDLSLFFSSRRRHTRFDCDWSSDVCSSDLYVGILRSAELTGNLDTVLDQLAVYIERDLEAKRAVKSALTYPIVIAAMASVTVLRSEERRVGKGGRSRWSPYH